MWATIVIIIVSQFAFTNLPILQGSFATAAVSFLDGVLIVGVGLALFAVLEVEKQLRLRVGSLTF